MKTVYVVQRMDKTATISVNGQHHTLDFNFADGMVGVMSVFDKKEDAEVFADGRFEIMECTI